MFLPETIVISIWIYQIICQKSRALIPTVDLEDENDQYQLSLPVDRNFLCPEVGYKCGNGEEHFLCRDNIKPCPGLSMVEITDRRKEKFIAGHNGIRNKVAAEWNIANMNLVHWSIELASMAELYLQNCYTGRDTCMIIGNLIVNQNFITKKRLARGRWTGHVVRSWYLELGYLKTFGEFLNEKQNNKMENFTQMIWPSLEFIGCATAFTQSSYYLTVCYYYPSYKEQNFDVFTFGQPCTKCSKTRNICSMQFTGLCGIDIEYSRGDVGIYSKLYKVLTILQVLFFNFILIND